MRLTNDELLKISGGFSLNGTLISALTRVFTTIIDFGKMVGTSLRRSKDKNYC